MKAMILMTIMVVTSFCQASEESKPAVVAKHLIEADQLKGMVDNKEQVTIIDARSQHYFDGTLLPGAKWLSMDSTEEQIQAALPSKTDLIVVYCAGHKCPASALLAEKLNMMGYTNVKEYHEGLEGWVKKGYPTTKAAA